MFNVRVRQLLGVRGHTCIRLPAAVAFPTDGRLLERIETSRKQLPLNSIKPVRRSMPCSGVAS
jgi:hypothetical protein